MMYLISLINPKCAETELFCFNIVSIMVVDALAPRVAWTAAAMILAM